MFRWFLRLESDGIWWMPRHQESMKDVAACDKPRGGGKQPLIRGSPNGETCFGLNQNDSVFTE